MKIRVLGAFGSEGLGQRPTAFLVDERVLVDAGTVTGALTVDEQRRIEHALVTHAHLDHVGGLAFLAETFSFCPGQGPVTVTGLRPVVDAVRTSLFNDVLWPDFARIPRDSPVLRFRALVEEAEQRVGDLWVTPVAVDHTVPTAGYIVHDGSRGFVMSGDTGPTEALWNAARGLTGIRAVLLECALPNRLARLAELARHFTPEMIGRELGKLPPDVPVWIYHVKPHFQGEIAEELERIGSNRLVILEQDKTYSL